MRRRMICDYRLNYVISPRLMLSAPAQKPDVTATTSRKTRTRASRDSRRITAPVATIRVRLLAEKFPTTRARPTRAPQTVSQPHHAIGFAYVTLQHNQP